MAVQTGRTVFKWTDLILGDSGATLRSVPFDSLSVCGVTYEEQDLTAFQDAVKGALPGMPDAPIEWGGPWDSTAVQSVGTLSGSHTVLSGVVGGNTPLTFDLQIGVRHAWEAGEPQFGISTASGAGYLVTKYVVDIGTMRYSARAVLYPGSTLPTWGTAAEV